MVLPLETLLKVVGFRGGEEVRRRILYRAEKGESLFDIFLRYSNQKRILAKWLSRRFSEMAGRRTLEVLDIGTSKGTLMMMLAGRLIALRIPNPINFHFIEPDETSVVSLKERAEALEDITRNHHRTRILQTTWEDFRPDQDEVSRFDVVICSHTIYHFPRHEFPSIFKKMTAVLKPRGQLFVIAREKDDIYQFIQRHYTAATGKPFNEITIHDAIPVLEGITKDDPSLVMQYDTVRASATFPFASNVKHAQALAGFFLQRPWHRIPTVVQTGIMGEFDATDVRLPQIDGVITITKAHAEASV